MAFSGDTNWEVRTTGSDNNGGGFLVGSTGTDYSQQDTPQVTYTDLVIGTTTTQLTSAANPFTAAHVGNIINITGGTGFTVQRVQINTVVSGVATCDKSCGTASSTGGTGNLGGGLATYPTAMGLATTNNVIWVKSGTYSPTTTPNITVNFSMVGYGTTHGDSGTATLNPTSASAISAINVNATVSSVFIKNLNFTKGGAGTTTGFNTGSNYAGLTAYNCTFTGLSVGIGGGAYYTNCKNCTFINNTYGVNIGIIPSALGNMAIEDCYFAPAASGYGIYTTSSMSAQVTRCVFNGGAYGISLVANSIKLMVSNCSFYACTTAGIVLPTLDTLTTVCALIASNNIFYGNARGIQTSGLYPGSAAVTSFVDHNAVGGQTVANWVNVLTTNDITLTANPFTNTATPNFSLNSTAGGGAACKGVGWPGVSGFGAGPSYPDVGSLQSLATVATPSNYAYSG